MPPVEEINTAENTKEHAAPRLPTRESLAHRMNKILHKPGDTSAGQPGEQTTHVPVDREAGAAKKNPAGTWLLIAGIFRRNRH